MLRCTNLQLRESQQLPSQEDSASTDGEEEVTDISGSSNEELQIQIITDALICEDNGFIISCTKTVAHANTKFIPTD